MPSWMQSQYYLPVAPHHQHQHQHHAEDPTLHLPPPPSPPSPTSSTPITPPQHVHHLPTASAPLVSAKPTRPTLTTPSSSSNKQRSAAGPATAIVSSASDLPPARARAPPPTISTFSASSTSFNHIHIVQPYLQSSSSGASRGNDLFSNSGLHLPGMPGSLDARPPRPANAWILYRSAKMKVLKPESAAPSSTTAPSAASVDGSSASAPPRRTQADISKLIAEMWKGETPEVRQYYEAMSDMKKAEHLAQYPTYRFQPMKKADKEKARLEKKAQKERERAEAALVRTRGTRSRKREESTPLLSSPAMVAAPAVDSDVQSPATPLAHGAQVFAWRTTAFQPYDKVSTTASKSKRARATVAPATSPSSSSAGPGQQQQPTPLPLAESSSPCLVAPTSPVYSHPTESAQPFFQQEWLPTSSAPAHLPSASVSYPYSYSCQPLTTYSLPLGDPTVPSGWDSTAAQHHHHQQMFQFQTAANATAAADTLAAPQLSFDAYNLFLNPGENIEIALPDNLPLDLSSMPELGAFADFDKLFNEDTLQGAGSSGSNSAVPSSYEELSTPATSVTPPSAGLESSTAFHHHHHQYQQLYQQHYFEPSSESTPSYFNHPSASYVYSNGADTTTPTGSTTPTASPTAYSYGTMVSNGDWTSAYQAQSWPVSS